LNDLTGLAAQFDNHGRMLAQAVELVDKSNRRADENVNERRLTLDALVASLDAHTSDLDDRLKSFSSLLDESLEAATSRAREVARIVAETSTGSSRAIAEQFDVVRTNAEQERKHTTEAMRSIYEQATGDAHAMFRDATERFGELLQNVKQMSAEMQRELETTRQELRRGVFELPQETAESAAQMRRVIVDQIEALAELNRIVARHGRGLDASEPVRRIPREEPILANAGVRAEAPRAAVRGDIAGASPPTAPRRTEAPSLSPGNGRGGGGWLSDLLSRASREPQDTARGDDRPARHTIESLDSISVDIARMIDHDAAAELWERYKRGERNVFTRRLYTLQGQKAFDEIRKRYRSDRDFKQTVDRYINEFERLLEEVSRGDRGQVVARTYLTSETGKVYTMLAHAAGRFGD
jgi:cell division septum initiation protein DivIVA